MPASPISTSSSRAPSDKRRKGPERLRRGCRDGRAVGGKARSRRSRRIRSARCVSERVRVPASARIGEEGDGFKIAMAVLDRLSQHGRCRGARLRAPRLRRVARARQSRASSSVRRSRALQLTQAAIATMATEIDAGALLVYRAAWTKDAGAARVTREAAMAKWFATEAAGRVCDRAVQLFGGRGVTRGEIVERLYRDVRALRIYEGASEVQQLVIAKQVLRDDDAPCTGYAIASPRSVCRRRRRCRSCASSCRDCGIRRNSTPARHCSTRFGAGEAASGAASSRRAALCWSYAELREAANRIAHVLVDELELEPGNRVLLRAPNTPMLAACWFAVLKAGGDRRDHDAALPRRRAALHDGEGAGQARALRSAAARRARAGIRTATAACERSISMRRRAARSRSKPSWPRKPIAFEDVETAAEDVALVAFTSGTTGTPKAAMHYHRDLLAICDTYCDARAAAAPRRSLLRKSAAGVYLRSRRPCCSFRCYCGAATLLLEKAGPRELLEAIARSG